jgi:spore maturation protein CgeB
MKYKIIIHEMLAVYRTTITFRGGCIYRRVDVMAVRVWCQDSRWYIYVKYLTITHRILHVQIILIVLPF